MITTMQMYWLTRDDVVVKQLDIGGKCVADIDQFPRHLRIRQVPWAKKGENR